MLSPSPETELVPQGPHRPSALKQDSFLCGLILKCLHHHQELSHMPLISRPGGDPNLDSTLRSARVSPGRWAGNAGSGGVAGRKAMGPWMC